MVRATVEDATWRLIRSYRLHASPPADLSALELTYVPVREDLTGVGIPALWIPPENGDALEETSAIVVIDRRTETVNRCVLFAHEVAHFLYGHGGSLRSFDVSAWQHDRQEREAREAAAMLLVPTSAYKSGYKADEVAALCKVPRWLVGLVPGVRL